MTTLNDVRNPAAAPATTPSRKGSKVMWGVAGLVGTVCIVTWIGFFIWAKMGWFDKPTAIVVATVGALSLEGTFWCIAAAIGVSVFEARKRIWRFVTGRKAV